jgi:hypothetical protein
MTIKRIKLNLKTTFLSLAAFVVTASGLAALGAHPANAAVLSTTCAGAGYSYIGSYGIYSSMLKNARTGTLGVYYKSSTGKNCAQATCGNGYCFTMYRTVAIKPHGKSTWDSVDSGNFQYYAGGVTTTYSTAGKCIDVYARFGEQGDVSGEPLYGSGSTPRAGAFCG